MPRPEIIRADTLDLQASNGPSAQDHSRQPSHPPPLGHGPAAQHQQHSLEHVQEERRAEQDHLPDAWGSGRSSHEGSDLLNDEPRMSTESFNHESDGRLDSAAVQQNGGDDSDMAEQEEADEADDDLDDKISSSPSISDGVYILFPSATDNLVPHPAFVHHRRHYRHHHHHHHQSSNISPEGFESLVSGESRAALLVNTTATTSGTSSALDNVASAFETHGSGLFLSDPHAACESHTREGGGGEDEKWSPFVQVGLATDLIQKAYADTIQELWLGHEEPAESSDSIFEPHPVPVFSFDPKLSAARLQEIAHDRQISDEQPVNETFLTNGKGESSQPDDAVVVVDDDDDFEFCLPLDSRFIDSGFGGQYLRETEDIDFEFVYALHTFVATVEGQANATKGDTMVLLDDTNSYWWLVRIVKDNTIGYLPAEHIETPTERLARLNKHRNLDLSASMLGDNPEKSKNPLRKAMRRRNARMVQFAPPTYYEASEVDWSDLEDREHEMEDDEVQEGQINGHTDSDESSTANQAVMTNGQYDDDDEDKVTKISEGNETRAVNGEGEQVEGNLTSLDAAATPATTTSTTTTTTTANDASLESRKLTADRSKNGTIRNTDSFFKDDSAEPKKISLTPNLLREESTDASRSNDAREKLQELFDQIDAETNAIEKNRDRKKKDKKPNMLSGLFKRKDKKIKVDEAAGGVVGRSFDEDSNGSPGDSGRSSPNTPSSPTTVTPPTQPLNIKRPSGGSKLTKAPPPSLNTKGSFSFKSSSEKSPISPQQLSDSPSTTAAPSINSDETTDTTNSEKVVKETMPGEFPVSPDAVEPNEAQRRLGVVPVDEKQRDARVLAPLTTLLHSNSTSSGVKKERLKKAKERIELDVDSSPELETTSYNPFADPVGPKIASTPNGAGYEDVKSLGESVRDLRDISPSSPIDPALTSSSNYQTSARSNGANSWNANTVSPVSPPDAMYGQTELHRDAEPKSSTEMSYPSERARADSTMTTGSSATTATPAPATPPPGEHSPDWNSAALRSYINDHSHNEVKDLLLLVHDGTGVEPLPQNHPTMIGLGFHQQQKHLEDMSSQLDSLLTGFLARKAASQPRAQQR